MENTRPLGAGAASLWRAPAHPTRRAYPGPLRGGPAITGEIAAGFRFRGIVVTRHLGVLADPGLIASRKRARGRRHGLSAVALERPRGCWAGLAEAGFASGSSVHRAGRNASALRVPGGLRALAETGSACSQLREPLRGARVVVLGAVHGRG